MSSATGSSSFNKREILTGAAVIFSMAMLMRIRRKKRNSKKSAAAAASLAERFAFPISVSGETKEILGIDLGDVVYMPPRLSAVSVVGLPEDSSNPIQNVCLVVDALTKRRDASPNSDPTSAHEADVADLLFSEKTLLGDEEQLTAAVRTYVTQHCAFLTGEMSAEERNGVRCQRLKDAPSSTIKLVDKSAVTKEESVVPSATKTAHSADTVPLEFGFEVTGADLHAFIALVPEAKLVILLVVVEKKENNQKNQGGSEGGSNFISVAFPPSSQTLSSKEMSDVRDSLDIALMLRRALLLKKSAIDRLIVANNNNNHVESEHKNNTNTKNGDSTGDSKSPLTVTTVSGNSASPSNIAEDKTTTTTTTSNNSNTNAPYVVVAHSDMKIRAVIPAEFKKATVEDVRCPSVAGGSELFLTLWPSTLEGKSEGEAEEEKEGDTRTFCRIIYHSAMPSTWEDDKAITDPTEKEDEFKRNAMRHFMGYVSNTITFHSVDIGGRDCLWFGEEAEGVCCRTYICPNFDISGQKAQRKKKEGSQTKGMLVIRWESPAAGWQKSQKALSNFLDYFQFQ